MDDLEDDTEGFRIIEPKERKMAKKPTPMAKPSAKPPMKPSKGGKKSGC
jgi:hypothetical protein